MNFTKIACKLLYYLLLTAGILYGATVLYSILSITTRWNTTSYGDGKFLHINFPFTDQAILNIDDNPAYILLSFLVPLTLYALFFISAAMVFKIFYQPRLFTLTNLNHLKRFYLLNLALPLPITILSSIFVEVETVVWLLIVVHFILGVFTFLTSLIFQQGLKLQNEQELFI